MAWSDCSLAPQTILRRGRRFQTGAKRSCGPRLAESWPPTVHYSPGTTGAGVGSATGAAVARTGAGVGAGKEWRASESNIHLPHGMYKQTNERSVEDTKFLKLLPQKQDNRSSSLHQYFSSQVFSSDSSGCPLLLYLEKHTSIEMRHSFFICIEPEQQKHDGKRHTTSYPALALA